jgi:hypothetical protein
VGGLACNLRMLHNMATLCLMAHLPPGTVEWARDGGYRQQPLRRTAIKHNVYYADINAGCMPARNVGYTRGLRACGRASCHWPQALRSKSLQLFARMIPGVDLLQIIDGDLGINLGGFQGFMTQQLLDMADRGTVFQHMGGTGMTEGVGRDVLLNTGSLDTSFHRKIDAVVAHLFSRAVHD